jgi:hypothetical protein
MTKPLGPPLLIQRNGSNVTIDRRNSRLLVDTGWSAVWAFERFRQKKKIEDAKMVKEGKTTHVVTGLTGYHIQLSRLQDRNEDGGYRL